MSKYKLEFQLKQHTPIIHFQHDQKGATLRASELKPKLDRFLIEKLALTTKNGKSVIVPKEKYKDWFNNKEKLSLDYKVRVLVTGNPDKYIVTSHLNREEKDLLNNNNVKYLDNMPYFAQESEINSLFEKYNTGEKNSSSKKTIYKAKFINNNLLNVTKWGLLYKTDITLQIQSFHIELLKVIKDKIYNFFVFENFGTRQSKGFGCFSIHNPGTSKNFEAILKEEFLYVYKGISKIQNFQEGMEKISKDYKLLKSGRGKRERGGYAKSQMFLYFLEGDNPIRWEKRKIKRDINSSPFKDRYNKEIKLASENYNTSIFDKNGNQSRGDPPEGYNYKYIRALLGLAEQFEFQTDSKRYKYVVQVESEKGIDRFRSPIQFVINENQIYLVANPINEKILSKGSNSNSFKFKLRMKENNKLSNKSSFKRDLASTAIPEDFDIGCFLKFALETGTEKINGYKNLKL